MNSIRLRLIGPLWLFGILPAIAAAQLFGQPLSWFYGSTGILLGCGVLLLACWFSGWVLHPVQSTINATCRLLRGLPPELNDSDWLPHSFTKVRTEINTLYTKQHQSLAAAEAHASQAEQRIKQAERLVRDSLSVMKGLFSASDEAMAVIDSRGTVIAANEKLHGLIALPKESLAGCSAEQFYANLQSHLASNENLAGWLERIEHSDQPHQKLMVHLKTDPSAQVELETLPMASESGDSIGRIWILRDRTIVNRLQSQLRESQKMGTLGLIAGGIAHDFNNLLTAIQGNLALAEMTPIDNNEEVKNRIEGASQATVRATELVKQLLGYSRRSPQQKSPVTVKSLLTDVQALLRHSVDPRISISTRCDHEPSTVVADKTELEQVLLNLGINARDAMSASGGKIELSVTNITHHDPANPDQHEAPYAMICVSDNGEGMPPEVQARIFEAFFTTKEPGKGTGLGLATAQTIVQEHGGWIECESTVGKGTVFKIYLPRVADAEKATATTESPSAPAPKISARSAQQRRILVVDDEAPVRSIAVNMLAFMGFEVLEAEDGEQALALLESGKDQIDAIMLDIYMPKLSGRDTFRKLRASGNQIPVIVCSGFVVDPDEFVILSQGHPPPVDIMVKPYSINNLMAAVGKLFPEDLPIKREVKRSPSTALSA
jgi:two-component system, cell cycle sensor histidine kinase and response regulator CckA